MTSAHQKVLVIGPSGSGKSTLSRKLGPLLGLKVFHLDKLYWLKGWQEPPQEEWLQQLKQVVKEESWLIDGNFGSTFPIRMPPSDTIIFLDYPRRIYMSRILKRIWTHHGKTRPDLTPGCPERLDLEFLRWLWGFSKHSRPQIIEALELYAKDKKVIHITHPNQEQLIYQTLGIDSLSNKL